MSKAFFVSSTSSFKSRSDGLVNVPVTVTSPLKNPAKPPETLAIPSMAIFVPFIPKPPFTVPRTATLLSLNPELAFTPMPKALPFGEVIKFVYTLMPFL